MCTAIKYNKCMGRNYDYEQSYDETVTVIPRGKHDNNYSIIGICTGLVTEYPLWYDAMNEHGLCISALAFTGNAQYNKPKKGMVNLPPYEFMQHIIGNH